MQTHGGSNYCRHLFFKDVKQEHVFIAIRNAGRRL